MYLCHTKEALNAMERDRLMAWEEPLEKSGCALCGLSLEGDDCYRHEDSIVCASCMKDLLFDDLGEDYRVR